MCAKLLERFTNVRLGKDDCCVGNFELEIIIADVQIIQVLHVCNGCYIAQRLAQFFRVCPEKVGVKHERLQRVFAETERALVHQTRVGHGVEEVGSVPNFSQVSADW